MIWTVVHDHCQAEEEENEEEEEEEKDADRFVAFLWSSVSRYKLTY